MRFVIYGAGAIGGLLGGLSARGRASGRADRPGRHPTALQTEGLTIERPDREAVLDVPAVGRPDELDWTDPTAVVLTMKSQDTEAAVEALEAVAPPETPIVCAQNWRRERATDGPAVRQHVRAERHLSGQPSRAGGHPRPIRRRSAG